MVEAIRSTEPESGPAPSVHPGPLDTAREELAGLYDARFGGFGSAPKFPHPTNVELLLRHCARRR